MSRSVKVTGLSKSYGKKHTEDNTSIEMTIDLSDTSNLKIFVKFNGEMLLVVENLDVKIPDNPEEDIMLYPAMYLGACQTNKFKVQFFENDMCSIVYTKYLIDSKMCVTLFTIDINKTRYAYNKQKKNHHNIPLAMFVSLNFSFLVCLSAFFLIITFFFYSALSTIKSQSDKHVTIHLSEWIQKKKKKEEHACAECELFLEMRKSQVMLNSISVRFKRDDEHKTKKKKDKKQKKANNHQRKQNKTMECVDIKEVWER
ncbi:hypothetical protein RFI_07251 [Reticulomyxa filosa]|uniref:Uncharacterized protein n=1 Tax=Reticulomyxa filosa TaxID=46433 RepID=X6NVI1_RETFI|nr:hypothetical protein RFI_07251 [Reticulomyxa filosa]|eukprot:ETO29868.1 hypothetical protein RFI_07251 [Reticulomyxa filosa]